MKQYCNVAPHRQSLRAAVVGAAVLLAACNADRPEAYGNFEATEVAVSAELSGRLMAFDIEEGQLLTAGQAAGRIDTVPLALQRRELEEQLRAVELQAAEAEAQTGVLLAELETARDDSARTARLYAGEAATARQLTAAEGAVRVLRQRITASRASASRARQESNTIAARIARADDQIQRSTITNPINGTVLATFVEGGEYVQVGRPLYSVARLDTLILRAWISGAQLAGIKVGDEVTVRVDADRDSFHEMTGRVSWIASKAEFTPTPIQTREERVDQVYAVKIRVPNPDGIAKIGMPGELVGLSVTSGPGT